MIDIIARCEDCRAELKTTVVYNQQNVTIHVENCSVCKDEAYEDGFRDGDGKHVL